MGNTPAFTVGDWTATPGLNLLEHAETSIKLEPRTMDLLVCLARHAPEVVSADQLIEEVWQGRVVSDGSIYQRINQLRAAFGDSNPDFIQTIPKRGYHLTAPVDFPDLPVTSNGSPRLATIMRHRWEAGAAVFGVVLLVAISFYVSPWPARPTDQSLNVQTIAVLPFANLNGDGGDNYLGEGIAEEVIHALSNGSGLRVVARTSSFQFQDTPTDIRDIGARLGAEVILEGSVRRENGRLRVMVQLVESESGYHLWSEAYDQPVADIITVERQIAVDVAQRLVGEGADLTRIAAALPPLEDISAYEYYLLGRQRMQSPTGLAIDWPTEDADRAIEHFRRAIAIDPGFARAYAGLADTLLLRSAKERGFWKSAEVAEEIRAEALAAINHALALDSRLAEAYISRGLSFSILENDRERAWDAYRQAIALNPNLVNAHYYLGKSAPGEEGLSALATALKLNPLSSETHLWMAVRLANMGRVDEAAPYFRQAKSLNPNSIGVMSRAGKAHSLGRPDEALKLLQRIISPAPRSWIQGLMATLYLDLNDYQSAEEMLAIVPQSSDTLGNWILLALAQGRNDAVPPLIQSWDTLGETDAGGVFAAYELAIGHVDHARARLEVLAAERELVSADDNLNFGYYPAIHAAYLHIKAGDTEIAATLLEDARQVLHSALEDPYLAGGAHYLLASIEAIQGDSDEAVELLETAIDRGWTRHWYAPLDPNLESLRGEPRFRALIAELRGEMDRLRTEM